MIGSPEEFAVLRQSEVLTEQTRATEEEASVDVWLGVIEQFPILREWVAHNKTVPVSILELLANDPTSSVRASVAGKRKITHAIQALLLKDPDPSVRERLACNSECDIEILQQLSNDQEAFVRTAAIKRLQDKNLPPSSFA